MTKTERQQYQVVRVFLDKVVLTIDRKRRSRVPTNHAIFYQEGVEQIERKASSLVRSRGFRCCAVATYYVIEKSWGREGERERCCAKSIENDLRSLVVCLSIVEREEPVARR